MIYSKSHQFIFCHVPKTGGTSLRSMLNQYSRPFENSLAAKAMRRVPILGRHNTLYDFNHRPHTTCEKARNLLGARFDTHFVFALFREPLDWLYSSYRHFVRCTIDKYGNTSPRNFSLTFEQYVQDMINLGDSKPCQGYMLISRDGRLSVDEIGFFHEIDTFISRIACRLNLPLSAVSHLNENPLISSDTSYSLSDKMKSRVREHWGLDFSIWNYIVSCRHQGNLRSSTSTIFGTPSIDLTTYDPWGYMSQYWSNIM